MKIIICYNIYSNRCINIKKIGEIKNEKRKIILIIFIKLVFGESKFISYILSRISKIYLSSDSIRTKVLSIKYSEL